MICRMALLVVMVVLMAGCSALPPPGDIETLHARQISGEAAQMHYLLIRRMLNEGKPRAALAHLKALAQNEGETPRLRFLRAEIRRRLRDHETAETDYWALIEEGHYRAQAHQGLALLRAEHDPPAAILHLREAVRLAPADAMLRNDLGYALLRVGETQAAVEALRTALELAPQLRRARLNLALALTVSGRVDQARAVIRRVDSSAMTWQRVVAKAERLKEQTGQNR